jgi:hypothetical protein
MTEPWWYWLAAATVVVLFFGIPLLDRWERRQDDRDRRTWERLHR